MTPDEKSRSFVSDRDRTAEKLVRNCRLPHVWVLAAGLLACAGCSDLLGGEEPNLSLRVYADPSVLVDTFLEVDIGGREYRLSPGQRIETHFSRLGDVPVRFEFTREGQTLATEMFTFRFYSNADHWIHALVRPERPLGHCLGELSAHHLDSLTDSLFLARGSLSRDAVC